MDINTRNEQHVVIMTAIYNKLLDMNYPFNDYSRSLEEILTSLTKKDFKSLDPYIINTLIYSFQHYGDIVSSIIPFLNGWEWRRLPLLSQAILVMSVAHYNVEKISKAIVISIAVSLGKTYLDANQYRFINAVLDEVIK